MLREREHATFREIRKQLLEDQDANLLLRAKKPEEPRAWARRFHACVIGVVSLLAVIMVLTGSNSVAVLFIAAAVTLSLAYRIEAASERDSDRP